MSVDVPSTKFESLGGLLRDDVDDEDDDVVAVVVVVVVAAVSAVVVVVAVVVELLFKRAFSCSYGIVWASLSNVMISIIYSIVYTNFEISSIYLFRNRCEYNTINNK